MKLVEGLDTEKGSYNVGNVIYHNGKLFIITEIDNKYGLVDLSSGINPTRYNSLQELTLRLDIDDILVSGKHLVDFD
ncbi:hypothetical protein HOS79_gp040 [Lactobacillus phage Nyseid]|uniref:Uncharacterized protein n=1 Tax=Lactobacillus phage Nyseid TaxID=2079432 RepID=A0A2K9VC57_9CAUD|nr:hypothetical protein HOS79_gp040 [Lactobacillus phage Nyseid]AUV59800.1 hypothetical protein [Lactobacillus phage Nyseid]